MKKAIRIHPARFAGLAVALLLFWVVWGSDTPSSRAHELRNQGLFVCSIALLVAGGLTRR